MKFSALLLVAIVTSANPVLQSAPRVIDPNQHTLQGSRIWGGTPIGFLTVVSDIPTENLPNQETIANVEEPQVFEAKDGSVWWGFKVLPPIADYNNAIFATSDDHRIWVSFKDNKIPSKPSSIAKSSETSSNSTDISNEQPIGSPAIDVAADADKPKEPAVRSGIWWGYPDGDFGKSPFRAQVAHSDSDTTSTAASPKKESRIWWGYPEGDFGKSPKSAKETSESDNLEEPKKLLPGIVASKNNIYWALPPKDAKATPENAAVGHDATGRIWWGYPVDDSKPTSQDGDGGIAMDKDGAQFRIYWGYPETKKTPIDQKENAAGSLADAMTGGAKDISARVSSVAEPKKKSASFFGAIKGLLPLGQAEEGPKSVTVEVPRNGEQVEVKVSAVRKGEMERKERAEAVIRMVQNQTDPIIREELGNVAEHLLEDLREYRINAAAAENTKGGDVTTSVAATQASTHMGSIGLAREDQKDSSGKEDLSRRFEELKAKYEKLLNVVGESA